MIKVLHVFGIMDHGGAEIRTVELMPLLMEKGIQFDYCVLKEGLGALDGRIKDLGGSIYRFPLRSNPVIFMKNFVRFLKESDYDVVHSHIHYFNGLIMYLSFKAGIVGRISHFRSISDGKGDKIHRKIYHGLMKYLINRYATKILAVCNGAMENCWNKDWQKDSRCEVIYNGIDLSPYKVAENVRDNVIAEFGLDANSLILINVGSFNPAKGHDILLESFALIAGDYPNAILLIAGPVRNSKVFEQMQILANELCVSKKVRFLGPRNDVPRLLKASDCFILSSRREGLPGVVLEAIASGLPVVATDLPGVREIARYSILVSIVPIGNPQAIYLKTNDILENLNFYKSKSEDFPHAFDLEVCAQKFSEVYFEQSPKKSL